MLSHYSHYVLLLQSFFPSNHQIKVIQNNQSTKVIWKKIYDVTISLTTFQHFLSINSTTHFMVLYNIQLRPNILFELIITQTFYQTTNNNSFFVKYRSIIDETKITFNIWLHTHKAVYSLPLKAIPLLSPYPRFISIIKIVIISKVNKPKHMKHTIFPIMELFLSPP